jgi:hypothetical protein
MKKSCSELTLDRLVKALHYLELARLSRALAYEAISPVIASENLIKVAIEKQHQIDVQD